MRRSRRGRWKGKGFPKSRRKRGRSKRLKSYYSSRGGIRL